MEVWLPAGPNIKPQYADITDVGYSKAFPGLKIKFQTDVFYKWMYNQIGYIYHANMLVNPEIEGQLRQGKGRSYGMEVSLNRDIGKLCGQISYTYSRSFLKIDDLNDNQEFPATFDRPHNFNVSLALKARPRWLIAGDFALLSGAKITTPTSFYYYNGYQVPVFTKMNNDQLPTYIRFDISTTVQLNKPGKNFKHSLTFAIYNLFGQQNPIFLYFDKTVDENGKLVIPVDQVNQRELTPSIRYTFQFMPSLTYQFQF
jgi:outer membrane receptor protein involved in Fe transport